MCLKALNEVSFEPGAAQITISLFIKAGKEEWRRF
jgi:hypothetical protein